MKRKIKDRKVYIVLHKAERIKGSVQVEMSNKTQWSMKRGKRDKRERKAGKSRVMSFSQREASLRNNLSARGEEVKKKRSDERDRKLPNIREREETTTHRSHDAYRPKRTLDVYYKEPLWYYWMATQTHGWLTKQRTHTPKQLLHSDTASNMMWTDEIRTHWACLLNRRRPC